MTLDAPNLALAPADADVSPICRAVGWIVGVLDALLGVAVIGLITFATAAFGTVKPWSEAVVMWIGLGIAGGLALRVLLAGGLPRTATYFPVAGFLILAVMQMVPLPDWLVGVISPQTLADKTRLLADLPGAAERLRHVTISYYLFGTHHDLRIVLLDSLVFLTLLTIARTPRRIAAILIGLSILAAALSGEALEQVWQHAPNILWINGADTKTNAGPFVNHSDFSQQMNQLSGAALALFLVAAGTPWSKRSDLRARRILGLSLLGLIIAAGVVATLQSESRGGITAMIAGGAIVLLTLALRRGRRGLVWLVIIIGCLTLAGALLNEFDAIYNHMLSLEERDQYSLRLSNIKDIIGISEKYPLTGTGLGTHEVFFPRYETSTGGGLSTHAENEYAQALEEMGYAGLACVLVFAGMIWMYFKRGATNPEPIGLAAIGLGFGLAAVEIQSFSDFGQHLPSLGCLSAVICALMVNLGRRRDEAGGVSPKRSGSIRRLMAIGAKRSALAAVLLGGIGWCAWGAQRCRRANAAFDNASALESFIQQNPWDRTPRQNYDVLHGAETAVELAPLNIYYRLWMGIFQWDVLNSSPGNGIAQAEPGNPAASSDLLGAAAMPSAPWLDSAQAPTYPQIVHDLNAARFVCPTYGPLYTFVGQLELNVLHWPIGVDHIRLGAELAPHDPVALNQAARLDAQQGLWDRAARLYRQLLAVQPGEAFDVIAFYVDQLHRPDMALEIEPNNYRFLQMLSSATTDTAVRQQAEVQIEQSLALDCAPPNVPPADELAALAQIRSGEGRLPEASELYRRAIDKEYERVDWHLAWGQVLLKLNHPQEATAQAEICLHLQPGFPPARALLDTISNAQGP